MNIKKRRVAVIAVGMLMVMSTSAFAHGHCGGRSRSRSTNTTRYSICSVDDCNLTYNHSHNGVTYAAHHNEDGHGHYYR